MQKMFLKITEDYDKKHQLEHHKETVFHHLVEEVGELGREISKETNDWRGEGFDRGKLEEELIDVLEQVFVLADDYDIDLEEVAKKKVEKLRKRFELD